jgi:hypothetical protein
MGAMRQVNLDRYHRRVDSYQTQAHALQLIVQNKKTFLDLLVQNGLDKQDERIN